MFGDIDGAVVEMDPLARDYLKNLDEMASRIMQALGGGQAAGGVQP